MTDSGLRLRSEPVPSPERRDRVARYSKETAQHRSAIADEFRAQLLAELGTSDSVVRRALVDSAVSAYVEINVLTTRFQLGRANDGAMERLGLARGQLARTLKLLGACQPNAAAEDNVETPAQWLARQASTGSDGA